MRLRVEALDFLPAEDLVLVAAGATRALQAADKKDSHANSYHHRKGVFVDGKPVNQGVHR